MLTGQKDLQIVAVHRHSYACLPSNKLVPQMLIFKRWSHVRMCMILGCRTWTTCAAACERPSLHLMTMTVTEMLDPTAQRMLLLPTLMLKLMLTACRGEWSGDGSCGHGH